MNWQNLKDSPTELLNLANSYSASWIARECGVDRKTVTYFLDRYGYCWDGEKWLPKDERGEVREGTEERLPLKEDWGEHWVIQSGEKKFILSKEKARLIRRDYTGQNHLTINQICRKYRLPRWKFNLFRTAFGLTHDDTPYDDEELLNGDPEELAEEEIQRQKDQFFKKLREKEIDNALKELEKYRQQDYWLGRLQEIITEHFIDFKDRYSGPMVPVHKKKSAGLMLEVPIVDLHLAKLCWAPETGENFDRSVAEKRFLHVIHDIYSRAKDLDLEKILFPIGNDFFNFDDTSGNTTKGTRQDNDSRWQKMFGVGVELLIKAIDILGQLAPVDCFVVPGNHDKQASYYAMMYLAAYFRDCPSVMVDTCPKTRKYRQFGKCLIGFSHLDQERQRIYGNMQVEAREAWGRTKYHEWHGAHLHSEQVKEQHGVIVRNLSSITAKDAWHFEKGYHAQPKNQSFLWDKERGLRSILITPISYE